MYHTLTESSCKNSLALSSKGSTEKDQMMTLPSYRENQDIACNAFLLQMILDHNIWGAICESSHVPIYTELNRIRSLPPIHDVDKTQLTLFRTMRNCAWTLNMKMMIDEDDSDETSSRKLLTVRRNSRPLPPNL